MFTLLLQDDWTKDKNLWFRYGINGYSNVNIINVNLIILIQFILSHFRKKYVLIFRNCNNSTFYQLLYTRISRVTKPLSALIKRGTGFTNSEDSFQATSSCKIISNGVRWGSHVCQINKQEQPGSYLICIFHRVNYSKFTITWLVLCTFYCTNVSNP